MVLPPAPVRGPPGSLEKLREGFNAGLMPGERERSLKLGPLGHKI